MRWVRSLYDWVLGWAHTPYGLPALLVLSFAESSFFPVPPDVLLIALSLGDRRRWARFAMVCTVASVLGGLAGYAIGWSMWSVASDLFFSYVPGFTQETFQRVQGLYEEWNFWVVFVAAFTPIPYKVVTITAGVFGVNVALFVIASGIGRAGRFFLVAFLLYHFGAPIRDFVERRFNLVTAVFAVLLIGGFFLLKWAGH